MAFEGRQTTLADSLFPTYRRQASLNVGGGNDGSMPFPFLSIPSGSPKDRRTEACYRPWSHNPHNDPYGLINCVQSSIKNRKPLDNTDCDGETDLQSLVSNILDESDSQDCYYNEGCLPTCNSIWAPKTLSEELLQYFQSEAQVQQDSSFTPNYQCRDLFSKAQGQCAVKDVEDFCLHSRSPAASQQWFFNLPNGDGDSCTLHPHKLPPGLPLPNKGNPYLSQMQQNKYDNMSADRGNCQPLNDFPELGDVFRPPCEVNSPCFDPYYKDHYTQSSTKPSSTEQYVPKDINQLVNGFQSFMASEPISFSHGDFSVIHKQMLDMHHEDNSSPSMPIQTAPAVQTQKQLGREFGIVQRERNGGVRRENFIHDFQALPGFNQHNTEYFQQPKPFSASLNHPDQYQNNITMHRENNNVSISHYSNYNIQQGQMQNKIKPQLQKNKMTCTSVFLGNGISARPEAKTHIREGEEKKTLAQNPCFDLQGSMHSQIFERGNSIVSVENTQQIMPVMYPVNDPGRSSSVPNNSNVSSRGPLPYGTGVPGMGVGDMVSASEFAAFNSYADDMMPCRGESTSNGMAPTVTTSIMTNQEGPMLQLNFFLDECYEQWRRLEKERKRIEVILIKVFSGKWTAAVTNTTHPKTPPNPTRVDNLIVKQIREEAKVASLLDRMESLCTIPLHMNIHTALHRHHTAINITHARQKEEISNMSKHQQQKAHFTDDGDTPLLVFALKDLAATTRRLRTALWCALQMTLPKPAKREFHNFEVPTCNERCSSPFEGYCFRL